MCLRVCILPFSDGKVCWWLWWGRKSLNVRFMNFPYTVQNSVWPVKNGRLATGSSRRRCDIWQADRRRPVPRHPGYKTDKSSRDHLKRPHALLTPSSEIISRCRFLRRAAVGLGFPIQPPAVALSSPRPHSDPLNIRCLVSTDAHFGFVTAFREGGTSSRIKYCKYRTVTQHEL